MGDRGRAKKSVKTTEGHNMEWALAGLKVMKKFKLYHLAAADPFTTKWKATIGDRPNVSIAQVIKDENRTVPFCCQRCKAKNTWFVLGVGKLVVEDGIGCIQMEKVFFHDKDCQMGAIRKMPVPEFLVFNYNFAEIMGVAYNRVVDRMSKTCFWGEHPAPPGHAINFGKETYNYDDRCYEYLPSDSYQELDAVLHQRAMTRFFYLLTAYLNMASETAATVLDLAKVEANLASRKPPLPTGFPECNNNSAHLSFFEISLLFGGHCMAEDTSAMPVHQICHKDGETKDNLVNENFRLKGLHKPGSFILPLEDERTIYVCTPMMQVSAGKGQCIWFHGALPHGGMTYKASVDGFDWKPAIHGHLDSSHHCREQGYFDFSNSEDVYFPLEHSRFMTDQFPVLNKGIDAIHLALLEIQERNQAKSGLSKAEAIKYNSFLIGWSTEDLELLPPKSNTNLGPAVILQQMSETVSRLEQLVDLSHNQNATTKQKCGRGKTEHNRKVAELKAILDKLEDALSPAEDSS